MELRDYLTALRRYWTIWVGATVVALLVGLAVVLGVTPSYQATATVFVAATTGDATSGAQFIRQRVTSYPDVARSQAVLGAVIEDIDLVTTTTELRRRISAINPPDSSQIDITVTDGDPARAAAVANAVAEHFGRTVEQLERPGDGTTPVDLTVTDPATVPAGPVFPNPRLILGLGLVVGLALGSAAAVVRSRTDTHIYTEDDVRVGWGEGAQDVLVISAPQGRRRRGQLVVGPAALTARRLAALPSQGSIRVLVLVPTPADEPLSAMFSAEVSSNLVRGGMSAGVTGWPDRSGGVRSSAEVQLTTGSPLVSFQEWRRVGDEYDGVVLLAPIGRMDRVDLQEIRSLLTAADARLLAVTLVAGVRSRSAGKPTAPPLPTTPQPPASSSGATGRRAELTRG